MPAAARMVCASNWVHGSFSGVNTLSAAARIFWSVTTPGGIITLDEGRRCGLAVIPVVINHLLDPRNLHQCQLVHHTT